MPTNPYFKDYSGEQDLTEDLTIEIIKTMGREMYYIPRDILEKDKIFGEGKIVNYKNTIPIEMYIDSATGFQGQGDIASKFGIDIKDNVFLTLSKKRFIQEIQARFPTIKRPREGDLVYFPLSKSIFEINFVEHENPFYQHGKLFCYKLTCELFTYNEETVATGTTDIDATNTENKEYPSIYSVSYDLGGVTAHLFYPGEKVYQVINKTGGAALEENATATAFVAISNNIGQPSVSLINIDGVIRFGTNNDTLKGVDSGIECNVIGYLGTSSQLVLKNREDGSPLGDNDELEVENIKLDIFDFTETDPFSEGNY